MQFRRTDKLLTVQAVITDEDDDEVSRRTLERETEDCGALARAVGVWAALVLDAEVERARSPVVGVEPPPEAPPPRPPHRPPPPPPHVWASSELHRNRIDGGATAFVAWGTGSNIAGGPSLFGRFETVPGLFVRPAFSLGRTLDGTTPAGPVHATWGTARLDACGIVPRGWLRQRRFEAELCIGPEIGILQFDSANVPLPPTAAPAVVSGHSYPLFAVGPSVDVSWRLAGPLSALVRAVGELDILRDSLSEPGIGARTASTFLGRLEAGLSLHLR